MWTIILAIIVLGVLAVLVYASMQPSSFSLRREADIKAAPETIRALIEDFREWRKWSPWEKLDPELKRTLSGAPLGKGSVYEWSGNNKVGQGRMEILESSPSAVKIKLDFHKPMTAHNITDFLLEPRDGGTHVTWVMSGPLNIMMKLMHVFMNMDKMVGKDFERGLASMKQAAETERLAPPA